MYHRVSDERFDPWRLAIAPQKFAEQLSWLTQHRTVIRLAEFADLHRRAKLPRDAVAITFDDGYACTAEVAAPLLEQFRTPATIFLAADVIRSGRPFWWDELQDIILNHPELIIRVDGSTIELGERTERDRQWSSNEDERTPRQRAFHYLWSRLRVLGPDELESAMTELRTQPQNREPAQPHRLMTAQQAQSIRSPLIEFGSHAMTHCSLPKLDVADKRREIAESVSACEALIGARPLTFAYPFGDFDAETEALVRDSGFECACTAEDRAVAPADRLYALPRVQAQNWNARKLQSALNYLALNPG